MSSVLYEKVKVWFDIKLMWVQSWSPSHWSLFLLFLVPGAFSHLASSSPQLVPCLASSGQTLLLGNFLIHIISLKCIGGIRFSELPFLFASRNISFNIKKQNANGDIPASFGKRVWELIEAGAERKRGQRVSGGPWCTEMTTKPRAHTVPLPNPPFFQLIPPNCMVLPKELWIKIGETQHGVLALSHFICMIQTRFFLTSFP